MPLYRVSVFYEQRGDRQGGWTTNFWNVAGDETQLISAINDLVEALQNLSGQGCNITKARYAVSPGFRVGDEILYSYNSQLNTDQNQNADYQTTAISVVLGSVTVGGKYKVTIWLSGNQDRYVANGGRLQGAFAASARFKLAAKLLKDGVAGWQLNVKNKARLKRLVTAISATGTVTAPNHGFDPAFSVVISNVHGTGRPRGSYAISNVTTNTFDLVGYVGAVYPGVLTGRKVIARSDTYTQVPIQTVVPKRATKHDRGRPTDMLSGKAKTLI